ncbi:MAG: hydrogenase expression/formation protein HypE [Barnesiella sp.]
MSVPHKYDHIVMAHGGGGRLTQQLIEEVFHPAFSNPLLDQYHDGAIIDLPLRHIAYTTDSFVVNPIFFPGGDIGDLAVNGTVNDLLSCGATPCYLSAGFIIEEGLPISELKIIVESMKEAAQAAGVSIVTGDTKVVERGKCDKIYINTSGIGIIPAGIDISLKRIKKGDAIILTGGIGNHGVCILSTRENLGFETIIKSDTAALTTMITNLLASIPDIHIMRDPTRGGLSSTLNEIAEGANITIEIEEDKLPVSEEVAAACNLLGLDPLYVANEGTMLIFVPEEQAEDALRLIRRDKHGKQAAIIGHVTDDKESDVYLKMPLGQTRKLDMLSGEQLPRIC